MKVKSKVSASESIILETLRLIETDEMRTHLFKWLTHEDVSSDEICAEIILNAPIPLEHKIQMLTHHKPHKYTCEIIAALNERYRFRGKNKNPAETAYRIFMYDQPKETSAIVNSYDAAIDYINRVRVHLAPEGRKFVNHAHGRTDIIQKWIEVNGREVLHVCWFLDDSRDVIYFYFPYDDTWEPPAIPGQLKFTVPFKPGDIVVTDCRPFASVKKVLILENKDTLTSVDGDSVTCLFINNNKYIDVGYFKSNEFLHQPEKTYVSALYRSKTYTEELAKDEAPLAIISSAIKKDAKLGGTLYNFLNLYKTATLNERYKGDPVTRTYHGTSWKHLQDKFGL